MIQKNLEKDIVIKYVTDQLKKLHPQKIILFGSRARGDYKEKSDYDFAFSGGDDSIKPKVLLDIQENAPTLHGIDIVEMDFIGGRLLKKILSEGVILYESKS